MKKRIILGLALMILAVWGINARAFEAAMTQVTIEKADMSMLLPASCYVLDQNITQDNPYLQKVGGDSEKIKSYYQEAGIVLNAIAEDDSYEIVVTMNENDNVDYVYNMQSLTEEQILEFANSIQAAYASYGYEVEGYELYHTGQASYVLFRFGQLYEEQKVQCFQYYTIRDSKIYNITLRSYTGAITEQWEAMMAQIVDSITFTQEKQEIAYENEDNGAYFLLAQGWTRVAGNQQEPYIQAQYVHSNELGESIQFFCMDLWGNMNSLHQLMNTREELAIKDGMEAADKNEYRSYVSGFFKDYEEVTLEKIGDVWYFVSDIPVQVESETIEGVYLQKSVVTIQNGILYAFQYGYYENSNLHETDFEEMLQSITYQSPKWLLEDGQYYKNIAGMLYKMTVVAMLIVVALAGIVYLYYKESKEEKL